MRSRQLDRFEQHRWRAVTLQPWPRPGPRLRCVRRVRSGPCQEQDKHAEHHFSLFAGSAGGEVHLSFHVSPWSALVGSSASFSCETCKFARSTVAASCLNGEKVKWFVVLREVAGPHAGLEQCRLSSAHGPRPCHSFTPGNPAPLCLLVFSCALHVCTLHGVSQRDRWWVRLAEMANEREREVLSI